MFESIAAFFQGDGLFVAIYAVLLGTILIIAVARILKKRKGADDVHYMDTEYQRENTSQLFIAPKQIDTFY